MHSLIGLRLLLVLIFCSFVIASDDIVRDYKTWLEEGEIKFHGVEINEAGDVVASRNIEVQKVEVEMTIF